MAIGGIISISIAVKGRIDRKPQQHRDRFRKEKNQPPSNKTHESQIRPSKYESLNGNQPTVKESGRRARAKVSNLLLSNPYLTHRFQHGGQELGIDTENGTKPS